MMCCWHSIKKTETSGVNMFFIKTSRDVGMVKYVSMEWALNLMNVGLDC